MICPDLVQCVSSPLGKHGDVLSGPVLIFLASPPPPPADQTDQWENAKFTIGKGLFTGQVFL